MIAPQLLEVPELKPRDLVKLLGGYIRQIPTRYWHLDDIWALDPPSGHFNRLATVVARLDDHDRVWGPAYLTGREPHKHSLASVSDKAVRAIMRAHDELLRMSD